MTMPKPNDPYLSVNYAVGGALSNNDCATQGYNPLPDAVCNATDILNAQAKYRAHPRQFQLRNDIPVPGTQRQIGLFMNNLASGKLKVDDRTLYLIFTGANDLSDSFKKLIAGDSFSAFYQNIAHTIPDLIAGPEQSAARRLIKLGAKNIVVVGMQNLTLTPEPIVLTHTSQTFFGRYLNAYLLNFLVLRYNLSVAENVATLQERYPSVSIHYVNLQFLFNRLTMLPQGPFYQHLGEACQNKSTETYNDIIHGNLINCKGFLYWNGAHFTNLGYTIIAYAVIHFMDAKRF